MIVDDEPLTREYMKINVPLIDNRWRVTAEAMEGCEALDILQKQQFDLIITDIKMPVMDGLELCSLISKRCPGQKVIIISGYDEFAFAKEAIRYGVHEYLLKPIVKEELQAALNKIAIQIERKKNEQLIYKTMVTLLAEDPKKQVVENLLKTVVPVSDIVQLFESNNSQLNCTANEHDIVKKTIEYIYEHYSEPISLALIADKIGVSPCYLSNLFHKNVGESYIKFLTKVRMEQAAKLLKLKPLAKICDIAEKVGYTSVKHFSYVFKQYFNTTPGEYQSKKSPAKGIDDI